MAWKRVPELNGVGVLTLLGMAGGVWATFQDSGFGQGPIALIFILNVGVNGLIFFFIGRFFRRLRERLERKAERRNLQATASQKIDNQALASSRQERSRERLNKSLADEQQTITDSKNPGDGSDT